MPTCKLCHQERQLCWSHIIPEFLHVPLYNAKRHMMGINGKGKRGWQALQQGLTEKLFCEPCEQHVNDRFEKPFKKEWVDRPAIPRVWPPSDEQIVQIDYRVVKLFHLSILFRASVSTEPTFEYVNLGPHEERIRLLLLNDDPEQSTTYPMFAIALVKQDTREIVQIVTKPMQTRIDGIRYYSISYGGANWWMAITSHLSNELLSCRVSETGHLPMKCMPWTSLGLVRTAARLLQRANA